MKSLRSQLDLYIRAEWVLSTVLVALLVGFYLLGYRPLSTRLADLWMQIDVKQRDLQANTTRARILPDVILAVDDLRARVHQYDKQLPRRQEMSRFIESLHTVVSEAALHRVVVEPGSTRWSGSYAEQPIQMKFEGDFLSVFTFLRQMEEMQRLTRVRDLKLRGAGRRNGQIEVELSLNIYFTEG